MCGESDMRNRTTYQVEICWIRHGKTPANERKCYLGRTEEGLAESGRSVLLQKREKYPKAELVVGSPMLRCLQTAEILYPGQKLKTIAAWREMDFGIFEGKNYKELSSLPSYQAWIDSGARMQIPEGESLAGFVKRCREGMNELLLYLEQRMDVTDSGRRRQVAAVVHGGTIMALLSSYDEEAKDYFSYSCGNGEGYRCTLCWEHLPGEKERRSVLKHVEKLL